MMDRKKGSVVYSFATPYDRKARTLYINVIPRYGCTNNCRFCSRQDAIDGKPNIYEKKAGTSLFLDKEPFCSRDIIDELEPRMKKPTLGFLGGTKEIAFVGLGEPLLEFYLVEDTIKELRRIGYDGKIRVDTNGQIKTFLGCWYGRYIPLTRTPALDLILASPSSFLIEGLTDIRISVNATNEEDYERLCRPKIKHAFTHVCDFVRDCISAGINTFASFVTGFDDGTVRTKSTEEYRKFAETLGVRPENVIIRQYIPPIC